MTIYITGDTHGGIDQRKIEGRRFPNYKNCTKDDYLIVLGDWGYIFSYNPLDIENDDSFNRVPDKAMRDRLIIERNKMNAAFTNRKFTTLVIMGNHENYDRIKNFPIIDKFGGKVRKINDSVYELLRGEIYNIDGYKIFTFGGAKSIDKHLRIEGLSWWKEEECTKEEEDYAIENLNKHDNKVDLVLTHTCSAKTLDKAADEFGFIKNLYDNQNIFFDKLKDKLEYKLWAFGHLHKDFTTDENEVCVFDKVYNIEEFLGDK